MAPPDSPSVLPKRRLRTVARRVERGCVQLASLFPLAFVYSLTSWAVWVDAGIGFLPTKSKWLGLPSSAIGVLLYIMLNISYTVAVFTDPGSPLGSSKHSNGRGQYSHLPTSETPEYQSYTVNRHGGARFCKKCQCAKPDRTHHCSSCKRCVLKMDHHCPWLATCVGLRNYKAFLLFLIYTSVFCWACFATASLWVWDEVLNDVNYANTLMPVNVILLAVIAGIIGLVLTGFTAWHISLAVRNLTTIESLENTRYLSPLRKALDRQRGDFHDHNPVQPTTDDSFSHRLQGYGQQILEAHANAIPGVTRTEEGEERPSPIAGSRSGPNEDYLSFLRESNTEGTPAQKALHRSWEDMERQRERDRYEDYLDSKDSEKIPHPFNHGWKKNLQHLFGDRPLLWPLPVPTTTGDGWYWEPSTAFLEARERIKQEREREWQQYVEQQRQQTRNHWMNSGLDTSQTQAHSHLSTRPVPLPHYSSGAHNSLGTSFGRPSSGVSMKTLRPKSPRSPYGEIDDEEFGSNSDEEVPRNQLASSKADRVLGITRDQFGSPRDESREEWRDWDE